MLKHTLFLAWMVAAGANAGIINFDPYSRVVIDGEEGESFAGTTLSGAGDVNGDGFDDYIIGAPQAAPGGVENAGSAYVVFGRADVEPVDLAVAFDGFRIDGVNVEDRAGGSVAGAGDVNGDGLADVILSVIGDDTFGNAAGAAYIVYGKTDMQPVDLATPGAGHTRFRGLNAEDQLGTVVSGAGDINGDGFGDVAIGARGFDVDGVASAGAVFVVFGGAALGPEIDLAETGWGFRFLGDDPSSGIGTAVSGAGDVDGDGLDDLVVGGDNIPTGILSNEGRVFVLFGKTDLAEVRTDAFNGLGFAINGDESLSTFGRHVSAAGDVNADGRADIIIGDPRWDDGLNPFVGRAFVIFGRVSTSSIGISSLGTAGFEITGDEEFAQFGGSASPAGDFNLDGFADVIVGSREADSDMLVNNGAAYLVKGKADTDPVAIAALGNDGLEVSGRVTEDGFGSAVSAAGDIDGDTRADVLAGAAFASPQMRNLAGQAEVILSRPTGMPLTAIYRARAANGDPLPVAVGRVGDATRASAPDSGVWIDYADGQANSAASSIENVQVFRSPGLFPGNLLNQHWIISTDRSGWSEVDLTFTYPHDDGMTEQERRDLGVFLSSDGNPPFMGLEIVSVDPVRRRVTVRTSSMGRFYLGSRLLLRDGFEE